MTTGLTCSVEVEEQGAIVDLSAAIEELISIADRRPEPGWAPFRSRVGADQYRSLYDAISRHVAPNSRVLDWGAGLGHLSYALGRCGFRAVGFALEPCELARQVELERYAFVQGGHSDPIHLPFRDESFEAVVSAGVLEHVHELGGTVRDSLREIRRTLRPGGVFICAHLPNQFSWIDAVARRFGSYAHDVRFREQDVRRVVGEAELTLVEWSRYGFLPRNSWSRLPRSVRRSREIAAAWRLADSLGSTALNGLCQNYLFVAQKPR